MFKQMLAVSVYGENSGLMECLPAGHLAMKFKKLIHVLLLIDLCLPIYVVSCCVGSL